MRWVGCIVALGAVGVVVACGLDARGTMAAGAIDGQASGSSGSPGASSSSGDTGSSSGGGGDASVGDASTLVPPGVLADWTEKRPLTIDNGAYGAFTDFPVLVSLDATRIDFSRTRDGGIDLRFTDANGAILAHEIESFANGKGVVWVRVPAIAAHAKTVLWMFYGNTNAPDASNAADVWKNGYVGVFHMRDAKDSTGLHSTSSLTGGTAVAGKISGATQFNGTSDYLDTKATDQLAKFTVDVWFKGLKTPDQSGWYGPVMRDENYGVSWDCNPTFWPESAQGVSIKVTGSGTSGACLQDWCRVMFADASGGSAFALNSWHHVTATYDGAALKTFVEGAPKDSRAVTGTPDTTTGSTKIAANKTLSRFFNGVIDEARISKVARSPEWIAAQHASMTDAYITY